ncbi:MAG: 4Fe-4S binding protein [Candidatus Thermoplasmatota archaeon]|nr:4Fe-4S binding protein [Candidatus Thermoplasmatota archaeon]
MAVIGFSRIRPMMYQDQITRNPVNRNHFVIPKGTVHFIPERCKACTYCWHFCPKDMLEESSAINAMGYHPPAVKEGMEDSCIACGMCETVCPEFAIYIEEANDRERAH